jgi:transcriptional regulator with XRE-family HTH domain
VDAVSGVEAHVRAFVGEELLRRGWSQQRLADEVTAAGVPIPQGAVSRWQAHTTPHPRSVSADEAVALADVFDVPLLVLLGLDGPGTERDLARLRRAVRRARAALDGVDA